MAIDFFVMPFSRYLSGAFVTPTMQLAWSQGLPYTLVGTTTRQIPAGEPFGGVDAAQRRQAFLAKGMLPDDLAKYPRPVCDELWDESSSVEPRFHRVDPTSYGALVAQSRNTRVRRGRSTWFGIRKQEASHPSHLAAQLFLPVAFDAPFLTELVFEGWLAGSAQTALRELSDGEGAPPTAAARQTLREALADAVELRLPMIVDQ